MKQIIFVFIFLCVGFTEIFAQNISIEFSIKWMEELDFQFKELQDHVIRPAYLHITYRNISDRPLYCLKISEGKIDLPEIISLDINISGGNPFSLYNLDDYFKRRYFVGFKMYPSLSWNIRNDTTDIEYKIIKEKRERPRYSIGGYEDESGNIYRDSGFFGKIIEGDEVNIDWLSYDLNRIYYYINSRNYSKKGKERKEQLCHYPFNITSDTIMNKSIDKFVFLKPGEAYIDKYNLIGFQITGGTFTFRLDDTKSLDYVETEPVYKDEANFIIDYYTKKQLPEKLGVYELFRGEFLTNQVTVQFPGIRLKK